MTANDQVPKKGFVNENRCHHFRKTQTKFPSLHAMKISNVVTWFLAFFLLPMSGVVADEEELVPGRDRIDTPAVATGLCVHNLFQSSMVIQRHKPIPIWGWAAPNEKVTVTLGDESRSTTAAADRSWKVELPAMPVSSASQTITVQGSNDTIQLTNILVGDVWVLAGQSNMEFELHKLEEGPLEILSANFDQIRLFTVPQQNGSETKSSFPRLYQWNDFFSQHFRQGYWEVCAPETVPDMSGIGYIFGRRIHMATRVPIGLVDVSRGGTTLMSWTPMDVLQKIDTPEVTSTLAEWDKKIAEFDPQNDLDRRIKQHSDHTARLKAQGKEIPADHQPPTDLLPGPATDMNRPGGLYSSTLSTIAGLPVKGVLWHQGYNEALMPNGHKLYASVFPQMIKSCRLASSLRKLRINLRRSIIFCRRWWMKETISVKSTTKHFLTCASWRQQHRLCQLLRPPPRVVSSADQSAGRRPHSEMGFGDTIQ